MTTSTQHRRVSKPVLSPPKLKNMQLRGGSISIANVGPFLIGGSTFYEIIKLESHYFRESRGFAQRNSPHPPLNHGALFKDSLGLSKAP